MSNYKEALWRRVTSELQFFYNTPDYPKISSNKKQEIDVWQKPTQYCKAINFQLKINKF